MAFLSAVSTSSCCRSCFLPSAGSTSPSAIQAHPRQFKHTLGNSKTHSAASSTHSVASSTPSAASCSENASPRCCRTRLSSTLF
ncbi:hypothetical protein M758_N003900 [Ceratodon purpureus]|nr:hypothetical protein M758_N003900 [Ceratodon purpureus]